MSGENLGADEFAMTVRVNRSQMIGLISTERYTSHPCEPRSEGVAYAKKAFGLFTKSVYDNFRVHVNQNSCYNETKFNVHAWPREDKSV